MRIALLAAFVFIAAFSGASAMESLSAFIWKSRVLVVFGSDGDKNLSRQISILKADTEKLADRDMVVLLVSNQSVQGLNGDTREIDSQRLRSQAHVKKDAFAVILIGKDGGVKLRSSDPLDGAAIFGLVDRMPMRRAGER